MEIIERSATDLARAIRDGELTSRAVVEAHVEHARHLNPELKAIAADRFEAALAEADAVDARIQEWHGGDASARDASGRDASGRDASAGKALPPFLGVPCTIKESFALEGMPNA